jgi:hypothetical protein
VGARTAAPNAVAVIVLLLAVCLPASAAPTPIHLGPGQPQAYAWQADESWPGGSLADSRLDQAVRFWRAGLSLPEVFAGIEEQTGVAISVWPPTDPAARMRVNLYLNPERTPTLREVMVQLSWAVRSSFACTDGSERRYFLLGIGEVGGEWARLAAAREARDRREQEQARQNREQMVADIEKYRPALALSREEAIRSLQGSDPLLLLTLISPTRRLTLELLCALRPEQLAALVAEGELQVKLADLPAATREELWLPPSVRLLGDVCVIAVHADPDGIWASAEFPGQVGIEVPTGPDGARVTPESAGVLALGTERVPLPAGRPRDSMEDLALHDALFGEEDPRRDEFQQGLEARWERGNRERERRQLAASLGASRQLSGEAAKRLAAVTLDWDGNTSYPLWRLQEAVARAMGVSMVSDCFSQPGTNPVGALSQLDPAYEVKLKRWSESVHSSPQGAIGAPEQPQFPPPPPMPSHEVSVLDWLTAYCFPSGDFYDGWSLEDRPLGWEWGDAGSFLRFRTQRPDVWRGVMLPEPVEKAIEEAIGPYLKIAAEGTLPREIPFPLDLRTQVWIVGQTDMLQRPGAALLTWDDPATPLGALHNHLAAAIVKQITQEVGALNWLTTLREDQWEALRTTGLTGADLVEEQWSKWLIVRWVYGVSEPARREEVLRQVHVRLLPSGAGGGREMLELRAPDGQIERSDFFPVIRTEVTVPPPPAVSRKE